MTYIPNIIEAALLVLITFLLGCMIGWFLRGVLFRRRPAAESPADAVASQGRETAVTPQSADNEPVSQRAPREQAAGRAGGNDNRSEPAATKKDGNTPTPVSPTRVSATPRPANIGVSPVPATRSANENAPKAPPAVTDPDPEKPPLSDASSPPTPDNRPKGLDAPRLGKADDLKKIKGVGPKIEQTLHELGVYHFDQIAAWTPAEIDWVDDYLSFKGRIGRDNWIGQAAELARTRQG